MQRCAVGVRADGSFARMPDGKQGDALLTWGKFENMSKRSVWFLSIVAAMGGFLFGYDTAVINGAEQQIQKVWSLSGVMHGWVMSSALWGTVLGALCGGKVTDRFGRKPTLFGVGALYLVSALWSALAGDAYGLMVARFIGGLAVGCSSIAAPVYIAEISPAESRGKMTALFQFNVIFGMCVSQFVNWGLGSLGESAWRWMLGAEAVPALLFTLLCPLLTESPRWLTMRESGGDHAAESAAFFCRANLKPILIAFLVAFFNQLSGINAVLYFARRIFEMAGFSGETSLGIVAGMGVVNALATLMGVLLIDRLGRRTLLIIGGTGYVVSLFSCSAAFLLDCGGLASAMVFLFVISHMVGQGAVIWVLCAEIFPTRWRAQGQSVGSFTHWFFAAVVSFSFPMMAESLSPALIFGFFGAMMVLHLLWAVFFVPETKGRSLT